MILIFENVDPVFVYLSAPNAQHLGADMRTIEMLQCVQLLKVSFQRFAMHTSI